MTRGEFNDLTEITVGDDEPLRLDIAAKIAFPDGSMTGSGFRRENSRGRLVIERIAGKDYTTLANIKRMRELCRLHTKDQGSSCEGRVETNSAALPTRQCGSLEMVDTAKARDAALTIASKLSNSSPTTSPGNVLPKPRRRVSVHPLKFPSPTS